MMVELNFFIVIVISIISIIIIIIIIITIIIILNFIITIIRKRISVDATFVTHSSKHTENKSNLI